MTPIDAQPFDSAPPFSEEDERTARKPTLVQTQPFVAPSSARAFQRDLFFYWSAVRARPVTLTKQERLYRKDTRRVNAALLYPEPIEGAGISAWTLGASGLYGDRGADSDHPAKDETDVPRLLFLRLLMVDLGLLVRSQQTLHAPDRPAFLQLDSAARIRSAYDHWREGTSWNEMLSIPGITIRGCESRTEPVPEQVADARQRALQHIAAQHRLLAGNRSSESSTPWVPIEQIINRVREQDYEFLFPRTARAPLRHEQEKELETYRRYLGERSPYISYGNRMGWSISPPFANQEEGWDVVEAGFIRAILLEPLYWMGLVDVGYVEGAPVAYRLTPVGAWVMGVGPEVELPEQEGRIIVQPNFEILALDPISDQALAELDEFAQRASGERAIKYQLSRESVYRAQKRGWSARRILAALARLVQPHDTAEHMPEHMVEYTAADALPQNVVRTLEDWQELYERITIRCHANLVHASDPALLQQLSQDRAVSERLIPLDRGKPGTTTAALIVPGLGQVEDLIQRLEAAGYPPARTRYVTPTEPELSTVKCLRIAPDGQIQFEYALPSIYVLQRLASLTDRVPESDRLYLTESSVQQAMKEGMTAQEILAQLRGLHYGPLPHWVEIKVRAWAKYYGQAAVQTVTLVQVRDPDTLQELLEDPEMAGLLERFTPDAQKALAVVSAEDVDRLIQALEVRGIDTSELIDGLPGESREGQR